MAPGDFAQTLKQQADIVRVIGDYVTLRKAGAQNFTGLCPFHNEKSPSFSVHATRQFFHCFGCGVSGDVYTFLQKINHDISFPEAVRLLAQRLNVPMPKREYGPEEAAEARQRAQLIEMHERACAFFEEQLRTPEGARAREYLAGRGLGEETIKLFRIGYAPESGFLLRDRLRSLYDEELLRASGLFSFKDAEEGSPQAGGRAASAQGAPADGGGAGTSAGAHAAQRGTASARGPVSFYSKFRNRVTFPICDEQGRVIAFTARTLATDDKSGPKYLNSPETPLYSKGRVLFNLDKAKRWVRELDYAILVEGQMDCISVYAANFHNVLATSGTAFTEAQVRLLGRFSKNVVVNFDPDTAGANAAERSIAMLVEEGFEVRIVTLEPGFDPDLLIRRQGPKAYMTALQGSQRFADYLIERAQKKFPPKTADAKVQALNFLLPHMQRVPNPITRDEFASDAAQKLGIDSALLRQELKHAAARRSHRLKVVVDTQITEAERWMMRALALPVGSDVREQARRALLEGGASQAGPAVEANGAALHAGLPTEPILSALLDAPDGADPLSLELSEADRKLLAETLMQEHEEMTPELVQGAAEALRRRWLERRQRDLQARIADAQRRNDMGALARLSAEKLQLARAMRE